MANFTYEKNDSKNKLETYEWDTTWWDNTKGEKEARIFIIGDSISVGYRERKAAADIMRGKVAVDSFGTSKAIDNEHFEASLELFFAQQIEPSQVIYFNNGLHGWHLSIPEYEECYAKMVKYLKTKCENVVLVLTTPVRDSKDISSYDKRNDIVIERNEAAKRVAESESCRTLDFYSIIENQPQLYSPDGVHLDDEGYKLLAKQIYASVKDIVK